jgi:hypothetical protein
MKTRTLRFLAAAALAVFGTAAQATPIVFDFGGSLSLTCNSSQAGCTVSQLDTRLLNLTQVSPESFDGTSLVKSLNAALRDVDSISIKSNTIYFDLGRTVDTSALVAGIKQDSNLLDALAWRPSFRVPGRFEWRRIKTPVHSVPEPGTTAMFAVALFGLWVMWRRRQGLEAL